MLELAILGLLKERPMHGYDLRKRLRENFGLLANLSFGSLYPALARLQAAGAVAVAFEAGAQLSAPIPLTGSLAGERAAYRASRTRPSGAGAAGRGTRARKVYEITEAGEAMFDRLLEGQDQRTDDARSFSLRLAFARHLSPPSRLRLLERQRAHLGERLIRTRRSMSTPPRPLDPYERSLAEHSRDTTETEISWLDRLIAAERESVSGAPAPSGRIDR
jgi:DNA-binding PadR family transcriptional regulator